MCQLSFLAIFLATVVLAASLPINYQNDLGIDGDSDKNQPHIVRQKRDSHKIAAFDATKAGAEDGSSIVFAEFDHDLSKGLKYKGSVGILDVNAKSGPFGASTKFGTLSLESGFHLDSLGGMLRPSITEGSVKVGPGTLNMGVNFDTGAIIQHGLEVKWLGIGGAITKDRIEACFILCLGFSWG